MTALDDASLARVRDVAWLRPSREVTAEWVAERFARHLAAIAPFAKAPLPPARADIVHSARAACDAIRLNEPVAAAVTAWSAAMSDASWKIAVGARELEPSRRAILDDAAKRVGASSYPDGYHALVAVLNAAFNSVKWPPVPFAKSPKTPDDPVRTIHQHGVTAFEHHVQWSFLFDTPSPWAPIIELWEAGLWVTPATDARLVAWVPQLGADSVIVADPDHPGAGLPSLGFVSPGTPFEIATRALRDLAINVGLATPPGAFSYPLIGNPPPPG